MRMAIGIMADEQSETWSASTWYTLGFRLMEAASDRRLPKRLRKWLEHRADACFATGDWLNGKSAEDWERECAAYRAEDEAMERKANKNPAHTTAMEGTQLELAMA